MTLYLILGYPPLGVVYATHDEIARDRVYAHVDSARPDLRLHMDVIALDDDGVVRELLDEVAL